MTVTWLFLDWFTYCSHISIELATFILFWFLSNNEFYFTLVSCFCSLFGHIAALIESENPAVLQVLRVVAAAAHGHSKGKVVSTFFFCNYVACSEKWGSVNSGLVWLWRACTLVSVAPLNIWYWCVPSLCSIHTALGPDRQMLWKDTYLGFRCYGGVEVVLQPY